MKGGVVMFLETALAQQTCRFLQDADFNEVAGGMIVQGHCYLSIINVRMP